MDSTKNIYQLSPKVVLETFDNGGLVLIIQNRELVELNPSAVDVINLLDGKNTLEQVATLFAQQYEIPSENAWLDVLELTTDLYNSGILTLESHQ